MSKLYEMVPYDKNAVGRDRYVLWASLEPEHELCKVPYTTEMVRRIIVLSTQLIGKVWDTDLKLNTETNDIIHQLQDVMQLTGMYIPPPTKE